MNVRKTLLLILMSTLAAGSAIAEYRTPGLGTVYTLEDVVGDASGEITKLGGDYLLFDKVIISPSDELQIAGETIWVATNDLLSHDDDTLTTPVLIIEGRLEAAGARMESVTGPTYNAGQGIVVSGRGHEGAAEAVLADCTFENLQCVWTVSAGGSVVADRCRATGNWRAAALAFGGGALTLRDCVLAGGITANNAMLAMERCQIQPGGLTLLSSAASTRIEDCTFESSGGIGLYGAGNAQGLVTGCQFTGFEQSAYFAGTTSLRVEGCEFIDPADAGWICDGTASPVLRNNQIVRNTPGEPERAAILVLEQAQPDLGTAQDAGQNTLDAPGELLFYHAGTVSVPAYGNDWGAATLEEVEPLVYHLPDDATDADGSEFQSGWVRYGQSLPRPHFQTR